MEFPSDKNASWMRIDTLIPSRDVFLYDLRKISSLEACLTKSITIAKVAGEDLLATPELIEIILALEVTKEESALEEVKKTSDGLVLKKLPKGLKYTFFGLNETKSMIISSQLDNDMESKLLGILAKSVLERNFEAFASSIDDIKGISPSICMHKILMEVWTLPDQWAGATRF